ncbi:MAG TPA: peptidase M49 [Patescibacteria group bacterium]|nr:peptidase M49 [Patescibacteria group bacterium]
MREKAAEPAVLETVGEFAIAPLPSGGLEELTPRERVLAFYLSRAAIAGRDIYYDQLGRSSLEIRDLLEEILTHPRGVDAGFRESLLRYLKLFWINNGNHNDRTKRKFVPDFTFDDLRAAALAAQTDGAEFRQAMRESLDQKLQRLRPALFDPAFEPLVTCKSPPAGSDILGCSSVNFYDGVTLADLERFEETHPLNSRVVKRDGRVVEEVWRAGRGAIAAGRYAPELRTVIGFLDKAAAFAEPAQRAVLGKLGDFFATGDPADFRAYNIEWVRTEPRVDTINGFIETYKDPRSRKGAWQGVVFVADAERTRLQRALAAEAQYFEDRAPWDDRFKRRGFTAPVAAAVRVLMAVGDSGPMPPLGVNLPNDEEVSEKHGNRSLILSNVIEASNRAQLEGITSEFALPEDRALLIRHGAEAEQLMTALHEIVGHAAGKVDESLRGDPQSRLRENYAAIEEARAELVALHHIFDPRLREIGAISSPDVADAACRDYLVHDLSQLRRARVGGQFEDDHMRATHLIVEWLRRNAGGVEQVTRDGRTYLRLVDVDALRRGVARLLAEVQRIKGEGDARAARALMEQYGIRFDERLRDEVCARADRAGIVSYVAYVMPEIVPVRDASGDVIDARIATPSDFVLQMLRFSGKLPMESPAPR